MQADEPDFGSTTNLALKVSTMSADLGEREYLDIRTEVGFWYVSKSEPYAPWHRIKARQVIAGMHHRRAIYHPCQAQAWLDAQSGNHLESIVWQQEPA